MVSVGHPRRDSYQSENHVHHVEHRCLRIDSAQPPVVGGPRTRLLLALRYLELRRFGLEYGLVRLK